MGTQAAARTGTQNERYDLVSVLYHTLQEAETLETYIHDAQQGGDDELANFLRSVQEEDLISPGGSGPTIPTSPGSSPRTPGN